MTWTSGPNGPPPTGTQGVGTWPPHSPAVQSARIRPSEGTASQAASPVAVRPCQAWAREARAGPGRSRERAPPAPPLLLPAVRATGCAGAPSPRQMRARAPPLATGLAPRLAAAAAQPPCRGAGLCVRSGTAAAAPDLQAMGRGHRLAGRGRVKPRAWAPLRWPCRPRTWASAGCRLAHRCAGAGAISLATAFLSPPCRAFPG